MKETRPMDRDQFVDVGSLSFFVNMAPAAHGDDDFERLATAAVEALFSRALRGSEVGEQFRISYVESRPGCLIVTIGLAIATPLAVEFVKSRVAYRRKLTAAARQLNGQPIVPERGGRTVWLYRDDLEHARAQVYANNVYIVERANMGDTYNVSQAGAVGRNAQASHNTFQQVWLQSRDNVDLSALTRELAFLRGALQNRAQQPEQLVAAGQIAAAELQAKKGGGAKLLEHLKEAGTWAFEVATEIGVELTASLIKKSLGLPE